jgi:WD40 repeat protein
MALQYKEVTPLAQYKEVTPLAQYKETATATIYSYVVILQASGPSMTAYIHIRTLSEGHSDSINSLAFSRCGRYLASSSDDKCVIIWRLDDGSILYRLLLDSSVTVVFCHPTLRDTVIIGCEDGNLCQLRHLRIVCLLALPRSAKLISL